MSGRCYTITLPDGSQAIVRTGKRGWKPSPADIKAIQEVREALIRNKVDPLSVCPGCGCFRDRCACDFREVADGL